MFSSNASQVSSDANYIEDVFSTYLVTPTSASTPVVNGIDLAGKGGMLFLKERLYGSDSYIHDTLQGASKNLRANTTAASSTNTTFLTSFNSNGFTLGSGWNGAGNLVSWTFRKQPKFFDIVTYTGDGTSLRALPHSLGSKPGCVIIKRTDSTSDWLVAVRHPIIDYYFWGGKLNSTDAFTSGAAGYNYGSSMSSTQFNTDIGSLATDTNASGGQYIAYLFAHDAGGFGLSGNENVVSCGSYTGTGAVNEINLGHEVQWLMTKNASGAGEWHVQDIMRGMTSNMNAPLYPNTSGAENVGSSYNVYPTATGFGFVANNPVQNNSGTTYIYIAIRRGPMKVPTDGTKVFAPNAVAGYPSTVTTGFPVDLVISSRRSGGDGLVIDRLRGSTRTSVKTLATYNTAAEGSSSLYGLGLDSNVGYYNNYSDPDIWWNFRRAPSFFDEVCYTGNGATQTITHNLGVVPELIIAKNRGQAGNLWPVLFNFTPTTLGYGFLNTTTAENNQTYAYVGVMSAQPTATTFSLINSSSMNASGFGIVAYLFASCPGVSKVGSYTGTGTTQAINCGFTAGARFVMIKRTDAAGDWYVWDSARGIVAGNDPYLLLNSTAVETASTDYIDPSSAGFEISSTAPAAINASGGSYIFLAVA